MGFYPHLGTFTFIGPPFLTWAGSYQSPLGLIAGHKPAIREKVTNLNIYGMSNRIGKLQLGQKKTSP